MKIIKIICMCSSLISFLGIYNFLYAQEIVKGEELYQEITIETITPYFEALKNGDVGAIKLHISEGMYERYKVLLEKNKDYPEFLRKYYRDVDFEIEKIEWIDNDILVSAMIKFPNNESLISKFLLRKEMDKVYPDVISGRCKIVKQLSE